MCFCKKKVNFKEGPGGLKGGGAEDQEGPCKGGGGGEEVRGGTGQGSGRHQGTWSRLSTSFPMKLLTATSEGTATNLLI